MAMAFRGLGKPTDQLDISIAPSGGGFSPIDPGMSMPTQMPVPAAPERSTWGRGGKAWDIIGSIGDTLSALGGGRSPVYLESALKEQEAERQRQASFADWQRKFEYERDYERRFPKPINNDTANDFEYIKGILGESAARQWLQNKTDPIVSVPVPGGTYMGPRSGMGAVAKGGDDKPSIGNSAPQAAVDYLRNNPSLADQFDAKYGRGAAAAILQGGAPSQGGAMFP